MNAITRQEDPAFDPNAGIERGDRTGKQLSFADTADSPLVHYLSIVRRRIWLVLGVIAASLLLALYIAYSTIPLYRASTTIEQLTRRPVRGIEPFHPRRGHAPTVVDHDAIPGDYHLRGDTLLDHDYPPRRTPRA